MQVRRFSLTSSSCLVVAAGGEVVVANRTRAERRMSAAAFGRASAGLDELAIRAREAARSNRPSPQTPRRIPRPWPPDDSGVLRGSRCRLEMGCSRARAAERGLAARRGSIPGSACQALLRLRALHGQAARRLALILRARRPAFRAPNSAAKGRKVALVGLMGAGKTQAGHVLARLVDIPFIDADGEIEADAGMTVSDIFAREGESGFRARERRNARAHYFLAGTGRPGDGRRRPDLPFERQPIKGTLPLRLAVRFPGDRRRANGWRRGSAAPPRIC